MIICFHVYFYRRELIERIHNFVHLNLCIALSLGLFFFLTGMQTATSNSVSYTGALVEVIMDYIVKFGPKANCKIE